MRTSTQRFARITSLIFLLSALAVGKTAFAVEAPQPTVNGSTISWPQIDALGINVHRGNGDYLTSLPGTATQWTPAESGQYLLVGTDSGSWTNWGRSQVVNVTVGASPAVGSSDGGQAALTPGNFRIDVYSQSALELFWNHPTSFNSETVTYIIRQDGNTLVQGHTGSSWFVEGLAPGQTYRFELEARVSISGDSVVLEQVDTTPGTSQSPSTGTTPNENTANDGLTAPANVSVSVYSETAAEVFWDRSESAARVEYRVFLDDVGIGITEGTSFFLDNLLSGTEYRIRVVANDGATVSTSEPVLFSTLGVFRLTPVGRPLLDANTHGFGFWDNMTFEQQQRFPSDCLFAGNQFATIEFGSVPSVCFSPFRRELINSGIFRFSLPGDNATNHVEVVEWVGARAIALIADITTEFGQSRYELSLFDQSGFFMFTQPILESIVTVADGETARAINLDGKDLREFRDGTSRGGQRFTTVFVIGEYYELIPNGNPGNISGWTNAGAFASRIDTFTGELLSDRFFPGRTQESITPDDLPDFRPFTR